MPTFSEPDPEVLQDRADRPVLRVGDRVRHPSQPWSSSVQALLAHLREVGFTEAPQPFGVTPDGDEVAFIPGVGGDDACLLVDSDSAVAAVGDLLRRYHEAVAGWRPRTSVSWFDGSTGTGSSTSSDTGSRLGDTLVCHGDVGPWNLVWRDGRIVGLIDWEHAHVGTRTSDIAYALQQELQTIGSPQEFSRSPIVDASKDIGSRGLPQAPTEERRRRRRAVLHHHRPPR